MFNVRRDEFRLSMFLSTSEIELAAVGEGEIENFSNAGYLVFEILMILVSVLWFGIMKM